MIPRATIEKWFNTLKNFAEKVEGMNKESLKRIALEVTYQVNALTLPLLRKTMKHIHKINNYEDYVWYLSNMKA